MVESFIQFFIIGLGHENTGGSVYQMSTRVNSSFAHKLTRFDQNY